jgi:hypothetical protein
MSLLPIIGLLGGFCFAYCGVPAAWATIKAGKSVGTPVSIAWMIAAGTIFMYSYLFGMYGFDPILTINYAVEGSSWGTIVWYHYNPRKP